jgi:hypothetical protein
LFFYLLTVQGIEKEKKNSNFFYRTFLWFPHVHMWYLNVLERRDLWNVRAFSRRQFRSIYSPDEKRLAFWQCKRFYCSMSFDLIIGQDHVRVWLIFCISAFGRCEFWSKVNYYSRLMGNCFIKAPFPPTSYFSGIYASFTCVCVCVCVLTLLAVLRGRPQNVCFADGINSFRAPPCV